MKLTHGNTRVPYKYVEELKTYVTVCLGFSVKWSVKSTELNQNKNDLAKSRVICHTEFQRNR